MENTSSSVQHGLRRSKRNKYHLDVASLLLSSSSSIRREQTPPAQEERKSVTSGSAGGTRNRQVEKRRAMRTSCATTTMVCNLVEEQREASSSEAATAVDDDAAAQLEEGGEADGNGLPVEQGFSAKNMQHAELAEAAVVGTACKSLDIQLPDQLLEEEPFFTSDQSQIVASTGEAVSVNPIIKSSQAVLSKQFEMFHVQIANVSFPTSTTETQATVAGADEGVVVHQQKRKRKIALKYKEYLNDAEMEDEDDGTDDVLFKTIKVEYTVPETGKPGNSHCCPNCPAVFASRVGLTNHLKLHGAQKEFPCELCDFSCTNKKTMRQHRRIHGLNRRPRRSSKNDLLQIKPEVLTPAEIHGLLSQQDKLHELGIEHNSVVEHPSGTLASTLSLLNIKVERAEEVNEAVAEQQRIIADTEEAVQEEEGMPMLDHEQDGCLAGFAERKRNGSSEASSACSATRKAPSGVGSKAYDRNTIKCPHCPFRTQSKQRLQPHLKGHTRSSGFKCSACGFLSESSGLLRRHSQLHEEPCKWPPDFVGVSHERIAKLLVEDEGKCKIDTNDNQNEKEIMNLDHEDIVPPKQIKLEELLAMNSQEENNKNNEELKRYTAEQQQTDDEQHGQKKNGLSVMKHKFRHHLQQKYQQKKLHWQKYRQLKASSSLTLNDAAPNPALPTQSALLMCRRCGLHCRSGLAQLALHHARHHRRQRSVQRDQRWRMLCRELLAERLAWRDDRSDVKEQITEGPFISQSHVNSNQSNNKPATKVYRCRSCPFSTDQVLRLQKHENKHLLKSEHQCSCCTFSCRSLDILAQHQRLHEKVSSISRPPSPCATSTSSIVPEGSAVPRLAPIRRNEAHYCPHCPYSTKHNCDMKAHMKMHEVRSKFACSFCTYTTKRQNALISHEQLHRKGPLLGSPAVLGPRGAKCRRLKRIVHRSWPTTDCILGTRIRFDGARTHFYRCRACGEEMPFCASLARHARHHRAPPAASEKRFLRCERCSFITLFAHCLQAHQSATHNRGDAEETEHNARTDAGIFKCKECPFASVNYAKFWNHRQKHKRANRFSCTLCTFSSGSAQVSAEHLALHGNNNIASGSIGGSMAVAENITTKGREENKNNNGAEKAHAADTENAKIGATLLSQATITAAVAQQLKQQARIVMNSVEDKKALLQSIKFEQFSNALPSERLMRAMMGTEVDSSSTDSSGTISCSSSSKLRSCSECPFETADSLLLKLHSDMHRNSTNRPFACTLCTFSCFSADSLHAHLSLHASANTLEGGGGKRVEAAEPAVAATLGGTVSSTYNCSQCAFKCVELEQFISHRKEHVQLLQQRLMTIIKRSSAVEILNFGINGSGGSKSEKAAKVLSGAGVKSSGARNVDKQHYCTRCSFRCDTVQAFTRHWEHHRIDQCRPGIFRCSACDYSSDTHNVVLFHERNHHLDIPLSSLCRNIELQKLNTFGASAVGLSASNCAAEASLTECSNV